MAGPAEPKLAVFVDGNKIQVQFKDVTFGELTELIEQTIVQYLKYAQEEANIEPKLLLDGFHSRIRARLKGARYRRGQFFEVNLN